MKAENKGRPLTTAFLLALVLAHPSLALAEDAKPAPLESAYFVVAKEVPTPMGYGIHAFGSKDAAVSFAKAGRDGAKVVALVDIKIESAPDSDVKM
jgi:hypothetical protein